MSEITYLNKHGHPVGGVTPTGHAWETGQPSLKQQIADRLEFVNRVDQLMEERRAFAKTPA